MPFTVVIFAWRKPGLSPAEFKTYYEETHIPLVRSIAGSNFPLTHTRYFIQRAPTDLASSDKSNAAHPAVTFVGAPHDFDYDSYAELVFEDDVHFQAFFAAVSAPEAAAKLAADEAQFLDRPKMTAASIDHKSVTSRDG